MASFTERDGRWRALVRMSGVSKCATFATRGAAKQWAQRVESECEELRSRGVMQPQGTTVGDLIDRYVEEFQAEKRWGRSKTADLAKVKKILGNIAASRLTSDTIIKAFRKRKEEGAGRVVVTAQLGYLIAVLKVARKVWRLDVPFEAANDAREALTSIGLTGKSKTRDRRVNDAEITKIIEHVESHPSTEHYGDLVRFALASAMRISEVCSIKWVDLDEKEKTVIVRDRKDPRAKFGNDQVVPLLNATGFDAMQIVLRQPRGNARIFPLSAKTVSSVFPRFIERLQLGDLHLHDLRHEAISRLFEAGFRIEQVALVSGHRDWKVLKRYTQVRASDLHRAGIVPHQISV